MANMHKVPASPPVGTIALVASANSAFGSSVPLTVRQAKFGPPNHPQVTGLSHVRKEPKWTLGPRRTDPPPSSLAAPGPGTYNGSKQLLKTTSKFHAGVNTTFGRARREIAPAHSKEPPPKTKPMVVPGPGAYGGHFTSFGY
eukprot:CAMPEP_0206433588 /NCGR_PEP_ID=MMETSP0324_2-20121206/8620_1 /ASSEMBLY_ACC=CAM_ASM_000836 /TAXON_ID=2866 /ORGANISM="Crypthecodinium cohnii, Strain Seligo" /LENGTH=141 /DNA_ID=CAMNT_0053899877 /DNA_START=139 /DNA_END=564 /DNA_ORIENTATION=-